MSLRYWKILACIVLVLTTVIVYADVRTHQFISFDDDLYVTANPTVQNGLTLQGVAWAFTTTDTGNWIPLTWLSHMANCSLFGLNPAGHLFTNLLLHIANTLLLFLFFLRTTQALGPSFLVAALFALHPLHVESVAWVSERKDVLSTFFWLLAMWAYVWYTESPGVRRYLAVLVCFILGMMSKSMLMTLPFVLLLLDYWPLKRWPFDGATGAKPAKERKQRALRAAQMATLRRLILEKVPLLVLVVLFGVITFYAQKESGAVQSLENFSITDRLANALVAYISYIKMMLWPSHLAMYYPLVRADISLWRGAGAGLILLFLSLAVIWQARRLPYLLVGWLWYLGTLVPVIGLVHLGDMALADRYTYVPLIGLFLIAAYGLRDLTADWRAVKTLVPLGTGILLAVLAICTYRQVSYWHDSQTLYEYTLRVTKNNYLITYNLGNRLYDEGKLSEALAYFKESVRINPNYVRSQNNLGVALENQGKLEEAIFHYQQALRIDPDYAITHHNLGQVLYVQGKRDQAISHFTEALRIQPDYAEAHNDLGLALYAQGQLDQAASHYREALRLKPGFAKAHFNLGAALYAQGQLDQAISHYREALRLKPDYPEAHNNLGVALVSQGKVEQAIMHYQQALQVKPNYAWALNNLADVLATAADRKFRNGPTAVQLAEEANRLTGFKQPGMLDTLAAAYAAAGRFPEAVRTSQKAMDLAQRAGKPELAKQIAARMRFYRAGRPYRAGSDATPLRVESK